MAPATNAAGNGDAGATGLVMLLGIMLLDSALKEEASKNEPPTFIPPSITRKPLTMRQRIARKLHLRLPWAAT